MLKALWNDYQISPNINVQGPLDATSSVNDDLSNSAERCEHDSHLINH